MLAIIALVLIAIVALTVLSFAVHVRRPVAAAGGRRHPAWPHVLSAALPPVVFWHRPRHEPPTMFRALCWRPSVPPYFPFRAHC